MYSWENPDDRISIAQMNSELQHAQLELLSAHCATHQLRLRFSADDLARFGQRDILRKSVQAAAALSEYYASIEKKIPSAEAASETLLITEDRILEAVGRLSSYLREQREHYIHAAAPLTNHQKALMWPYFSADLLDRVRIVELEGMRIPNPPFYDEYRALGFANLPEVAHMHSLTFLDVIVFNEKIAERTLFHGLVHAVQFELLGLERYSNLFVRSFVNTKLHFSVPLEAHAFSLESKFAGAPANRFSVEDQVRLWAKQARY
ncbi:MAG TPA: hypothetical protein VNX26_14755 [Candidatus Acidoferrum sp.]|jgi:hypothetical protein|nr:hypothetical protein [Candidatus Acidoferrum sp.]